MVKGEVDIVEDWVLYHGTIFGFNNLFVIDNFSRDGTFQKLIELKKKYGINITRLPDYKKKGIYMTSCLKTLCKNELAFPIDIDEFIVLYKKDQNTIVCNKDIILNYLEKLPYVPIFKMNYINAKVLKVGGYERATVESTQGTYLDYGEMAKTFFRSNLFNGTIDHGNHYTTNSFFLTDLCLVHFHTRNMEQIKKKVYNNVSGFNHNPFNLNYLKTLIKNDSSCEGFHHIIKQIEILENRFILPAEKETDDSISLVPLNNYIKSIK